MTPEFISYGLVRSVFNPCIMGFFKEAIIFSQQNLLIRMYFCGSINGHTEHET